MRIRVLAGYLNRDTGANVYNRNLIIALRDRGYEVSVVCFAQRLDIVQGVKTYKIVRPKSLGAFLWRLNPLRDFISVSKQIDRMDLPECDLVIGAEHLMLKAHHKLFPETDWVYLPHSLTMPLEVEYRAVGRTSKLIDRLVYKHIQSWALKSAHSIMRFSRFGVRALKEIYPEARTAKFITNPTGVRLDMKPDSNIRQRDNNELHFLVVGGLSVRKNVKLALEALAKLPHNKKWNLWVIGSGSEEVHLRDLAQTYGISDKVKFLGHTENIDQYYTNADILLFPSLAENFALVPLEAMTRGLPVLALSGHASPHCASIEELIEHGVDGLLANSSEEFSDIVGQIVEGEIDLERLGGGARDRILEYFTFDLHIDRFEAIISEIRQSKSDKSLTPRVTTSPQPNLAALQQEVGQRGEFRVSVVVPTYNRAEFLPETLDSIFNQSEPPLEVIVVDDGSTDNTEEIISRDYPNVRYEKMNNAGASLARRRGEDLCQGDWVAYCDSDDVWRVNHLKTIRAITEKFPVSKFVCTNHCNFYDDPEIVTYNHFEAAPAGWWDTEIEQEEGAFRLLRKEAILGFLKFNPAWTTVSAVHKSVLPLVGHSSEAISRSPSEDGDFTRRIVLNARVACTSEITVCLRKHEGNDSAIQINNDLGKAFVLLQGLADNPELFGPFRDSIIEQVKVSYTDAFLRAIWERNYLKLGHIYRFSNGSMLTGLELRHHLAGKVCAILNQISKSRIDPKLRHLLYETQWIMPKNQIETH